MPAETPLETPLERFVEFIRSKPNDYTYDQFKHDCATDKTNKTLPVNIRQLTSKIRIAENVLVYLIKEGRVAFYWPFIKSNISKYLTPEVLSLIAINNPTLNGIEKDYFFGRLIYSGEGLDPIRAIDTKAFILQLIKNLKSPHQTNYTDFIKTVFQDDVQNNLPMIFKDTLLPFTETHVFYNYSVLLEFWMDIYHPADIEDRAVKSHLISLTYLLNPVATPAASVNQGIPIDSVTNIVTKFLNRLRLTDAYEIGAPFDEARVYTTNKKYYISSIVYTLYQFTRPRDAKGAYLYKDVLNAIVNKLNVDENSTFIQVLLRKDVISPTPTVVDDVIEFFKTRPSAKGLKQMSSKPQLFRPFKSFGFDANEFKKYLLPIHYDAMTVRSAMDIRSQWDRHRDQYMKDLNTPDELIGLTPIVYAILSNNDEMVKFLLQTSPSFEKQATIGKKRIQMDITFPEFNGLTVQDFVDVYGTAAVQKLFRERQTTRQRWQSNTIEGYHQTGQDIADLIESTPPNEYWFLAGSTGMYGPGIYFAKTAEETNFKALTKGPILKAEVYLGIPLEIRSFKERDNFEKYRRLPVDILHYVLRNNGYDSVVAIRNEDPNQELSTITVGRFMQSGNEYIVYNTEQAKLIEVLKLRPMDELYKNIKKDYLDKYATLNSFSVTQNMNIKTIEYTNATKRDDRNPSSVTLNYTTNIVTVRYKPSNDNNTYKRGKKYKIASLQDVKDIYSIIATIVFPRTKDLDADLLMYKGGTARPTRRQRGGSLPELPELPLFHHWVLAIQQGDLNTLKRLVQSSDPNFIQPWLLNTTPLMIAAGSGQSAMVKWLLQYPTLAAVHTLDAMGRNALFYAMRGGNDKVVEALLNAGVSPTVKDTVHQQYAIEYLHTRPLNAISIHTFFDIEFTPIDTSYRTVLYKHLYPMAVRDNHPDAIDALKRFHHQTVSPPDALLLNRMVPTKPTAIQSTPLVSAPARNKTVPTPASPRTGQIKKLPSIKINPFGTGALSAKTTFKPIASVAPAVGGTTRKKEKSKT